MAKILIVDDSDILRLELSEVLTAGGHEVLQAADGAAGMACALDTPSLDLIITDLNMPELDGITMCRKIREKPAMRGVPVFILSTESSAESKAEGKAAGVVLWVVKPFAGHRLLAAIDKVLGAKSAAA